MVCGADSQTLAAELRTVANSRVLVRSWRRRRRSDCSSLRGCHRASSKRGSCVTLLRDATSGTRRRLFHVSQFARPLCWRAASGHTGGFGCVDLLPRSVREKFDRENCHAKRGPLARRPSMRRPLDIFLADQRNDEARNNDEIRMTKSRQPFRHLVIRASFVIRHSCFVIPTDC